MNDTYGQQMNYGQNFAPGYGFQNQPYIYNQMPMTPPIQPQYPRANPVYSPQRPEPDPQKTVRPLIGRIVASPSDITPQEIPMDGSIAIFPLANGSSIFIKRWTSEGTIQTTEYHLAEAAPKAEKGNSDFIAVMAKLDELEKLFSQRGVVKETEADIHVE